MNEDSSDFETCLLSRIFTQFFDDGVVVFYSTTAEKFDGRVADSNSTPIGCFLQRRRTPRLTAHYIKFFKVP